ncbi:helix-turn-helix domain-containing protein [Empedobacter brevis]|uniref:helix-turn-helix domain-containing protein n=1 Tax=Empedobacter brevis TaxID=247 RepID=UPI002FE3AC2C
MILYAVRFFTLLLLLGSFAAKANSEPAVLNEYLSNYNSVLFNNPYEVISNTESTIRNSTDEKIQIETYLLLAYANFYVGKSAVALENASTANIKAIQAKNESYINSSEFLLQRIYQRYDLSDFSKQYIADNQNDNGLTIKAIQYLRQDNFRETIRTYLQKDKLTIEDNLALSISYIQINEVEKAYQILSKIEKDKAIGTYYKAYLHLYLGQYYFKIQETKTALTHFEESLQYSKKLNHPYLIQDTYSYLTSLYLSQHSLNEFNIYSNKFDSITKINILQKQRINNNIFHHQVKIIEANKKSKENYYYFIIAGSIFLVIATLLIVWFVLRKKKENLRIVKNIIQIIKTSDKLNALNEIESKKMLKTDLVSKDIEFNILKKLEAFEKTNNYLSKNVSLGLIASQLDTNTKYLSEIINRHKKKNFNTYINELRIKYILNKLTYDPKYLNYKISYLAEECGFSSHSRFVSAFRNFTGTTPLIFINTISKNKEI